MNNNLYNTSYDCQYMSTTLFEDWELNILSKEEQLFVRNLLYKHDVLFLFYQEDAEFYEEAIIHESIEKLYKRILNANIPELNLCMTKLACKLLSTQLELGLVLLYSYDYLYLTHPCISELLETNCIVKTRALLNELVKLILN